MSYEAAIIIQMKNMWSLISGEVTYIEEQQQQKKTF